MFKLLLYPLILAVCLSCVSGVIKHRGYCLEKCILRMLVKFKDTNVYNTYSIKDVYTLCEKMYPEKNSVCAGEKFEQLMLKSTDMYLDDKE